MPAKPALPFDQVQTAMQAMIKKAMETPEQPIAMAIVDATGELVAYAAMDNLRLFTRRHAIRKAYTATVMGMDTGAHAGQLHAAGRSIADLGDPMLTHGQGGVVIRKDGVIIGGIGVGGYSNPKIDEDVSRAGLNAMKL